MSHESFVRVTFTEAARPNSSLLCKIHSTGICHHENMEQTNWFCPFHSCWQDSIFVMVGEDLMEQRGWGERGYLGDRGEARWKGGIEGGVYQGFQGLCLSFSVFHLSLKSIASLQAPQKYFSLEVLRQLALLPSCHGWACMRGDQEGRECSRPRNTFTSSS